MHVNVAGGESGSESVGSAPQLKVSGGDMADSSSTLEPLLR